MEHLDGLNYDNTPPKASTMINTFRAFGYDLKTAIADIIDNSISAFAKNVWIDYCWKGADSWVLITDDGYGMDGKTLIEAMTLGSKNPIDERDAHDLGRFGLGLKTSSFSQCQCLTVITKKIGYNLIKRHQDLDYINKLGTWRIHDYLSHSLFKNRLEKLQSGTTVVWEKMDRLLGGLNMTTDNEAAMNAFLKEFEEVEKHLSLVFHRYLDRKKLKIWIDHVKIDAWDPFMKESTGTQIIADEKVDNNQLQIKCYVIPHNSKINPSDYERERVHQWYDLQGFYVYRNDRLLLYGDWLKLFPKKEYYKNARILVDIPNTLDSQWKIDIKKSKAVPPSNIRSDLKRLASMTRKSAANVHRFREPITPNGKTSSFQKVWKVTRKRDYGIQFNINSKHPLIENLLKRETINKKELKEVLNLVAQTIPIETIIQSYDEGNHAEVLVLDNRTMAYAKKFFEELIATGITKEKALNIMFHVEPFYNYPQLKEHLVL